MLMEMLKEADVATVTDPGLCTVQKHSWVFVVRDMPVESAEDAVCHGQSIVHFLVNPGN